MQHTKITETKSGRLTRGFTPYILLRTNTPRCRDWLTEGTLLSSKRRRGKQTLLLMAMYWGRQNYYIYLYLSCDLLIYWLLSQVYDYICLLLTGSYWRPSDVIMVSARSKISAPTSAHSHRRRYISIKS